MTRFEQITPARIVFGRGTIARLPEIAAPFGQSALVVHNVGAPGDGGIVDRMGGLLRDASIRTSFVTQLGEPKVSDIDAGLEVARREACSMVVGLGGGSAIDAAKAIAALLTNGGVALDYMEVIGKGQKLTKPAAPWIAIPTTAGTGAEATRNAVVGSPEKHFKASIRSEHLMTRCALIDPELAVRVPAAVTASSGMDALCQVIESYTSTGAQPITDALSLQGIALAGRSLRRAVANGADVDAREDMALAALLSGITLTNAGLGAVHGFAAPLGANFPVPHGTVCAVLLPPVIAANVHAAREQSNAALLKRYATIGRTLMANASLSDDEAINGAIDFTAAIARDLHIPPLREFGMAEKDIAPMVALARKASSMKYNPIALPEDALSAILRAGIGG